MTLDHHDQCRLAERILEPLGYRCGKVPVTKDSRVLAEEFVVLVQAGDPAFTWQSRNGSQDPADQFPVGFIHLRLTSGNYALVTGEDETPVDLAEQVAALVAAAQQQPAPDTMALSA